AATTPTSPTVSPAASAAAGLKPATHAQVEKFRVHWNTTSPNIGSLLVPNTPAHAYVVSSTLITIDRKQQLSELSWRGDVLEGNIRGDFSNFRVDAKGRIADFMLGTHPVAELAQAGDRKTYRTPGGDVVMHVVAFRRFNIDGGNLSTVFTVDNHGKHVANV